MGLSQAKPTGKTFIMVDLAEDSRPAIWHVDMNPAWMVSVTLPRSFTGLRRPIVA